ncbi:MAG TPA: OsmC family peroxiredoxin [Ktedonobacterales bacterium]|nr:OsmC family peroxiredoxin [Ktedonobacterales bacterium]
MVKATQQASVRWDGALTNGNGVISLKSGAASDLPVSWASRTNNLSGKTSPEELLAAAHASCYAMAFSGALDRSGTPPQQLSVVADCTFEQTDSGFKVSRVVLNVEGQVPGLTQEQFAEAARAAETGCPVSNALRGNVDITVTARLV